MTKRLHQGEDSVVPPKQKEMYPGSSGPHLHLEVFWQEEGKWYLHEDPVAAFQDATQQKHEAQ